jgi:hypothetical protein
MLNMMITLANHVHMPLGLGHVNVRYTRVCQAVKVVMLRGARNPLTPNPLSIMCEFDD